MSTFTLPTIPADLDWQIAPLNWQLDAASTLTIAAGPKTDWFIDPNGSFRIGNAPNALFVTPDADFLLSAKVTVDFAATYDAGVLRIHEQDDVWAKLCFEYSPQGKPTIVSVVTRGFSDDCNSVQITGNTVYLRLARIGNAFAFHYSLDGRSGRLCVTSRSAICKIRALASPANRRPVKAAPPRLPTSSIKRRHWPTSAAVTRPLDLFRRRRGATPRDFRPHDRRDFCAEQLNRMHDLVVRQRPHA